MSKRTTSTRQHLTSAFGTQSHVEQVETALRTAAEHHTELAAHLRARQAAGHFDVPDPLITRDGARMLADNHDRRASAYTTIADFIKAVLDTEEEDER
jgi:hypothetical protein